MILKLEDMYLKMTDKNKQLIMVVRKEGLFGKNNEYFFEGFMAHGEVDFESRILNNYGFMTRGFAEKDGNYKQPVAYNLIVNPTLREIFSFQRAKQDEKYPEKRLQGKWSWGVGGHINRPDIKSGNPIEISRDREIREEIDLVDGRVTGTKTLGYIYIDEGVHAVHFGILYAIETDATKIEPRDPEIAHGKLRSLSDIEKILQDKECDVEGWSETAFQPLKEYLS